MRNFPKRCSESKAVWRARMVLVFFGGQGYRKARQAHERVPERRGRTHPDEAPVEHTEDGLAEQAMPSGPQVSGKARVTAPSPFSRTTGPSTTSNDGSILSVNSSNSSASAGRRLSQAGATWSR